MKHIFISRSLKSTSPISKIARGHEIIDKSLITISTLEFVAPQADWIFFYSRNGVKYFFEGGNYELFPYLWACMSKGTADELANYVTDISFIGEGTPDEVARAYQGVIPPSDITCFIRAENSLDSIHKRLGKQNDFSIPVYSNIPKTEIPSSSFDILIFTSPMNVDAWFSKRDYQQEHVISIGTTTANHLATYAIENVKVADSPSEESIAKILQTLL